VRGIDPALVNEVWREVMAYPPGRVDTEAREFLSRQPHVAAFAQGVVKDQDPSVQKAAWGLCFLLFKILERSLGRPFPPVARDRLAEASEAARLSLERSERSSPSAVLDAGDDPAHPTLVSHLLSVFYGDGAGAADYDEGVRARLFLLLRTLCDALDLGEVEP